MTIQWKVPNDEYLDFLRDNYEQRIPYTDYGKDKFKPFFGSLFEIGDLIYITQISHPQNRHKDIKQSLDFYKIYHPDDGRIISVINLNYMFPIHKSLLIDLKNKDIEKYRTFKNEFEKSKYINLLNVELKKINSLPIAQNSIKLYDLKYQYPSNKISQRSFEFKALENACSQYLEMKEILEIQEQVAAIKEKE